MAKLYHLNCPNCGGLIASAGERVVACKYCHSRSLVLIPDWMPRHYVEPRLDLSQARRAMVALFQREEVEAGLLQNARFESAELFFVPYYLIRARRVGVFTQFAAGFQSEFQPARASREAISFSQYVRQERRQMLQGAQRQADSRVVMSDVEHSFPAVEFEEWGLSEFDPNTVLVAEGLELKQYRREELDRLGAVLEPRVSAAQRMEIFFKMPELAFAKDQTELVERESDLVYYPVWRVRWRYRGKARGTSLDGVTGKILYTRAPARERMRMFWLLAVSAALGLSAGKLLKIPLFMLFAFGMVSVPLILIFATVLMFFVALGWNLFRYSSELVITSSGATIEFIGRPPETVFDKMAKGLSGFLEGFLQSAAQARRKADGWS